MRLFGSSPLPFSIDARINRAYAACLGQHGLRALDERIDKLAVEARRHDTDVQIAAVNFQRFRCVKGHGENVLATETRRARSLSCGDVRCINISVSSVPPWQSILQPDLFDDLEVVAVDPDDTLRAHAEAQGWPVISLR